MRLNKYLSEKGLCSRREADDWIGSGRVEVNRRIALLGTPVEDGDEVRVDGRVVSERKAAHVTIAFNKPVGVTCTTEARVRDNIIDFIGHEQRIFPIGRLDKDSEGLILLTSDGDIVNALLRAEHGHEKEYIVRVDRQLLGDIHELAAAIVALAGITLGIFVGHDRALRLENGARHDVFRGDQLDLVALAAKLRADRAEDFRIGVRKRCREEGVAVV